MNGTLLHCERIRGESRLVASGTDTVGSDRRMVRSGRPTQAGVAGSRSFLRSRAVRGAAEKLGPRSVKRRRLDDQKWSRFPAELSARLQRRAARLGSSNGTA